MCATSGRESGALGCGNCGSQASRAHNETRGVESPIEEMIVVNENQVGSSAG